MREFNFSRTRGSCFSLESTWEPLNVGIWLPLVDTPRLCLDLEHFPPVLFRAFSICLSQLRLAAVLWRNRIHRICVYKSLKGDLLGSFQGRRWESPLWLCTLASIQQLLSLEEQPQREGWRVQLESKAEARSSLESRW